MLQRKKRSRIGRMIVGLFNDSFPPVVDGVARVFLNYATELKRMGDRSVAVTPRIPQMRDDYPFEVLTFNSFRAPVRHEYRWGLGNLDVKFWKQIKDIPFDLLHSHCPFSSHLVARMLANRENVPLVSTFHSKYRDDFYQVVKSEKIVDAVVIKNIVKLYEESDDVWTVNEASAEVLREYGYQGEIFVMANGCDIEPGEPDEAVRREVRERFSLSDAPLFMYIGQHTVQKNMPMLLDALKLLRDGGARFNMLFVGDGALREEMEKTVARYELGGCVRFAGMVRDRELVKKIYLASAAMLFPSLYDTSSLVPREAAACMCPTVFVEGSSTAQDIVDGRDGFLAGGTPEAYAQKLSALLDRPELLEQVAQNARETLYRPWSDAVKEARERYLFVIDRYKVVGKRR